MSRIEQAAKANLGMRAGRHTASRLMPAAGGLLSAVAIGAVVAFASTLPSRWAALTSLAVCGVLVAAAWMSARFPLLPVLRLALLASFSFRMEIVLLPIYKNYDVPLGLTVSLMLFLSVILGIVRFAEWWGGGKREPVWPRSVSLAFAALFLCCILSVVYGTEGLLGVYGLWSVAISSLMCFVVAANFGDRQSLQMAVICIAATVGLNGLVGLSQSSFGLFTGWDTIGAVVHEETSRFGDGEISRVSGMFGISNAFAWYLVTFLPLILAMLLLRVKAFNGWQRLLLLAAAALGVVALILTYARGSWIAFVFSLLLLPVLGYRALPSRERGLFVFKLVSVCLIVVLLSLPFAGAIYTRLTEDDRGSAESRIPLMQVALTMIEDHPLLGVGINSYESEMRRYDHTPDAIHDDFDWPVHNIFLHMTAEAGIPGTLCFLMIIALAFWQGSLALRSDDLFLRALAIGLMVGLVAFMCTGLKELGSFGWGQLRLCYLFCGLLFAAGRASRKTELMGQNVRLP